MTAIEANGKRFNKKIHRALAVDADRTAWCRTLNNYAHTAGLACPSIRDDPWHFLS